ncbi:hypothetical protein HanIR_Chr15g0750401 [Helianthus annuus]|nr:hypothetical protein HanIR_Chr15g0750401 [Helianthus annuus]
MREVSPNSSSSPVTIYHHLSPSTITCHHLPSPPDTTIILIQPPPSFSSLPLCNKKST